MGVYQDDSYSFLRLPFGRDETIEQILAVGIAREERIREFSAYIFERK